ncbi:ribosome biogenesis protein Nop53/GLTSCR2 [Podospora aff. communis PSN243]|uniref:Ribosome biogenesis protein NOP53 n=1 Tax=Podospora aff. communis PSN243 TaxID=3040156 RepID=A0AAV9GR48_9PEZI|nr:ribosome biogenesis protein Nop53/GLTSCR2 [Podospora aff. communis PSN243]
MPVVKPKTGNTERPSQHNQPSRKGKKAWRKNVDVTEIEKGLEEVNEKVIRGEVFAAEKKSEELFTLDVAGDASIRKKFPKIGKTLKADEIIAARSAVPAVPMRKRPGDKTTDGILPVKKQRTTYVTHKELTRLKRVADGNHESAIEIVEADHDVWADPVEETKPEEVLEFVPKKEKKKAPKTLKQAPITLAANGKAVPAVAKPKGGHSYNPAFTDYQERLIEESEKVVEAEKKRIAELEAERIKLEAAARSAAEAEAAEARADLSEWEEDSAWEGFESGGEELSVKAKKPQRKTPAQRNKIKRRKEEERKAKHEARMKEKAKQAQRIKEIALEVAERERNLQLAKIEFSDETEEGNDEELRRRQLGKYRLPEKDLELVLPDELQDSLRLLKPEGNLLKDRYRNMLVRGKMETRRKIPYRKQAKTKLTEKWTFKDFNF